MRDAHLIVLCGFVSICFANVPAFAQSQASSNEDEIPLERCDRLPVVKVRIDGADYRFLVDTGATTFLNLKSFAGGKSKRIEISSWSGAGSTSAREVMLPELALGSHRLQKLRLPAVDLSAIGQACGGQGAQRICDCLANDGQQPLLSVGVGVATHPQDGDTIETLLQKADRALYRMKGHGGNSSREIL